MKMVWERLAGAGRWLAMRVIATMAAAAQRGFEKGLVGEGAGNKSTSTVYNSFYSLNVN